MKFRSLKTQMLFSILGIGAIIFAATILTIALINRKNAIKTANEITRSKSRETATTIALYLEKPIETARSLSNNFLALKNAGNINRDFYKSLMHGTFSGNKSYLAVWSMWEPNALDRNDSAYVKHEEYDEEGRFNYTCYRDGQEIKIETGTSVEQYTEDFYTIAFQSKKEAILEPYYYSYTGEGGQQFFETSIVVPVIENGQALGVTAVDIDLSELSEVVASIKMYDNGFGILISNNGVIAAFSDKGMLEKKFSEMFDFANPEILSAIKSGIPVFQSQFSKQLEQCQVS